MDRVRLLRKKATEPERILRRHLRNPNFAGYKFAANIRWTVTSWVSIVRAQSSPSSWTAAGITTLRTKLAIESGQNSWPAMDL